MAGTPGGSPGDVPGGQRFLDNIFLLMALGLIIPIISYTVWGLIEIISVPPLPVK